MSDRPFMGFSEAVERVAGPVSGLRVVDLGCGSGAKTRKLAKLGATATGLEPNPQAVADARETGGGPDYVVGSADAAPFEDGAFDLAVFTYSLHHCPDPEAALREAARITRPGGAVLVVEPEADDPIYPVGRLIDDEKPVYEAAQRAIETICAESGLDRAEPLRVAARYAVESAEALIAHMLSVDPSRKIDDPAAVARAFDAAVRRDDVGAYIPCWERFDLLRKPA